MKFKQLFITLAMALMLVGGAQAADLRVGVEGAYPPFSWKESVEQDWDGMIPALLAKKFDAIIASMSITEERKKRVDFSDKYYDTPARFIGKDGSGLQVTRSGLAGKRIGVQRGTTHQCFLEKMFPDSELVLYATQEEVFQDLAIGRIDLQFSDAIAGDDGFLKTDAGKGFGFVGGDYNDPECHGSGVGIAVRKSDKDLREELNQAIKAIRENGVYQKINAKYFDFDIYGG